MRIKILIAFLFFANSLFAQHILQPGFDAQEYFMLLSVTGLKINNSDSVKISSAKKDFPLVYRSQEVGLKNRWSYYENTEKKTGIISIRGTVSSDTSWAANYYFAMIPAKGSLQFSDRKFDYQLAESNDAAVHSGWTISLSFLADGVINKINNAYKNGIKDFYIFGHSQGGAIAYLLRSYLFYQQKNNSLPSDIQFKTYCSAPPKPGNTQYAYDFEFINRGGWAFSIVNALDWVPETPFTVQTMQDMNKNNPLVNMKNDLGKMNFFKKMVIKSVYNKIKRSPEKTRDIYIKNFGHRFYNLSIKKMLPGFVEPVYFSSVNYVRTGTPVVLMPDENYSKVFDDQKASEKKEYFLHHNYDAYFYLLKKDYLDK